jgi:hypothetical protein
VAIATSGICATDDPGHDFCDTKLVLNVCPFSTVTHSCIAVKDRVSTFDRLQCRCSVGDVVCNRRLESERAGREPHPNLCAVKVGRKHGEIWVEY